MDRLSFNAMAAIDEDRLIRQQLSNDIANVTTVGFKQTFEATCLLYTSDAADE